MSQSREPTIPSDERVWWKEAVFYQIYPRSFNDSDGDGIGDIPGIIEKADYLEQLGVDCVWLNPVYTSPQEDNGYDIADYRAIDPDYGSLAAWETLLEALHDRDIRLVMDLVVNHTSDQHAWFQRSAAGDPEYADYYHWHADEGNEPNNWESYFGGSAWSFSDEREEYYLRLFTDGQPDLNWSNPAVRDEIHDLVGWWLERGIDGFRMDVINLISKEPGLPDGTPGGDSLTGAEQYLNGPRMHEYLTELDEKGFGNHRDDIVTIGECSEIDPETAIDITGGESDAIDMTIFFDHVDVGRESSWTAEEWALPELKQIMSRWQQAVADGTWVALYHSNHDQPRGISRFGDETFRYASATMLATWLHGHKGTPFVYQGEEIGMSNVSFESPAELDDIWARNHWQAERDAGNSFEEIQSDFDRFSRDNARTPMQWSDDDQAGFTSGEPWLKVGADYERVNAAADRAADRSIFEYYQALIQLRKTSDLLAYGTFELRDPDHEQIYTISRSRPDTEQKLRVVCNFTADNPEFQVPDSAGEPTVLLSNYDSPPRAPSTATLRPYEAIIYEV